DVRSPVGTNRRKPKRLVGMPLVLGFTAGRLELLHCSFPGDQCAAVDIEVFLFHSLFLPRAARMDGACLKARDGRERPSLILVMARSALPCLKFSQELSQAVDGFGRALLHSGVEHPVAL